MRSFVFSSIFTLACGVFTTQSALADSPIDLDGNPAGASDRLPVPSEDAIAKAVGIVREAFGDQFAAAKANPRTSASLIASLVDAAKQTTAPDRRYALLQEAESVAIAAGDLTEIQGVVALRCSQFQVAPSQEFIASINRFVEENASDAGRLESAVKAIIDQASQSVDIAQAEELLDFAKTVNLAFAKACRKQKAPLTGYQALLATIGEMKKRLGEQQRLKTQLEAAEAALATNPEDRGANALVGGYRCFILGDWKSGLPLLAKGEAADLKAAAQAEIDLQNGDAPLPAAVLRIANAWWAAAEAPDRTKAEAAAIKAHAAAMYRELAATLSDPIDAKLAASRVADSGPQSSRPPARATPSPDAYRTRANAAELAATQGGGADTEAAVDRALQWIAGHQMPDGTWTFDLAKCPSCAGKCSHAGTGGTAERGGATALSLLPFLARGYTHTEGPYKKQIEAGVAFLVQLATKQNGKAYESGGNLYAQGIVGIALSECYGMSQDKRLAAPTQTVLNYTMQAQDPTGGGWRYSPRQPGDTSASGWHVVALKSGLAARLEINPVVLKGASAFFDSMQGDTSGSTYGYSSPGNKASTSAVGLLSRMYLGWSSSHRGIQEGAGRLSSVGPTDDLYYDYYATQVMHRVGGKMWLGWNAKMKKMLLDSQSQNAHEAGSWFEGFDKGHGPHVAGRLYTTVLATLILEEYYRSAP